MTLCRVEGEPEAKSSEPFESGSEHRSVISLLDKLMAQALALHDVVE